jgi:hypothetical protein
MAFSLLGEQMTVLQSLSRHARPGTCGDASVVHGRLTGAQYSAIHIFACVKNANPNNRVHWAKNLSVYDAHAGGRAHSQELILPS